MFSTFGCHWPYVWHLLGLHILSWPLSWSGFWS
jgi:hypothetical protein